MSEFDERMDKNHGGLFDIPHQRECFEAGAQSRQAEIAELQARVDGALKELELLNYYRTGNSDNAIKILKGNKDEN